MIRQTEKKDAKRPAKQEGQSWLSTSLSVKDVELAAKLYENVFGFGEAKIAKSKAGKALYGTLKYKDVSIMLSCEGTDEWSLSSPATSKQKCPTFFYLYTEDLEGCFEKAKNAKMEILQPIKEEFWGDKVFMTKDPNGYVWIVATNVGEFDPTKAPKEWQ